MVVSIYDGHDPMAPMPRFDRHPSCRGVRPWRSPAIGEQDVSDKPRYVRMARFGRHSTSLARR